jgi:hypothetical protein
MLVLKVDCGIGNNFFLVKTRFVSKVIMFKKTLEFKKTIVLCYG